MNNIGKLIICLFLISIFLPIDISSKSINYENNFLEEIISFNYRNSEIVDILNFYFFNSLCWSFEDSINTLPLIIQSSHEFLVNDDLTNKDQIFPTIAMNDSGYFVIAWADGRNNHLDIYLQRFDRSGNKISNNIKVNDDNTSEAQWLPSIGMDKYGNFVVTWMDRRNGNLDIYFQKYSKLGTKINNNRKVNDDTGVEMQWNPKIAVMPNGSFIIVWEDLRSGKSDIYFQRYDSMGNPIGANTKVNQDGINYGKSNPNVAIDDSGNFIIAWLDFKTIKPNIYIQMYNNQGTPIGQNILVNDTINSEKTSPVVIKNPNYGFIVVWVDYRNNNSDIYLQLLDKNGNRIGNNLRINNDLGNNGQSNPSISHDGKQKFIVVWEDARNDPNKAEIVGQKFLNFGEPVFSNFVLVKPDSNQVIGNPQIASNDSLIVLCWMDNRRAKGFDIYGKIITWDWNGVTNSEFIKTEPFTIKLNQNHPNPFNSTTRISWSSSLDGWSTLKIFDVFGREIITLVDEFKKAGKHEVLFNSFGLSSGVYFYQIKIGNYNETKKMILIK